MQEVPRVLAQAPAAWFSEHHAVVHEQQRSSGQRLDFMHQDFTAVEHGGDFNLIPLVLRVRKVEIRNLIEEGLQARNAFCTCHVMP